MTRQEIEELIYGKQEQQRRFTQDFPILPDVWIAYAEDPNTQKDPSARRDPYERIELLLTPHTRSDAATLTRALRGRLNQEQPPIKAYRTIHPPTSENFSPLPRILFNESVVFAPHGYAYLVVEGEKRRSVPRLHDQSPVERRAGRPDKGTGRFSRRRVGEPTLTSISL